MSANIQRKKHFGAPMKHSEYFASKTQKSGHVIVFRLLAACNEKFQRANVQPFAYAANAIADKAGWTRDSQAHTRLVDSLFFITCSLENNAFSVLHYVISVALHYLHRFEIFAAPGTIAHGSIRLPPRSLASSRGWSLVIKLVLSVITGKSQTEALMHIHQTQGLRFPCNGRTGEVNITLLRLRKKTSTILRRRRGRY